MAAAPIEINIACRDRQTSPIEILLFASASGKFSDNKATACGPDIYKSFLDIEGDGLTVNWTLASGDIQVERNVTFRLKYRIENDATIYEQIYSFPILPECNLFLLHETSRVLNHHDVPTITECKVWFPASIESGHGLVIELLKLNVPCSKGYIQFSGTNSRNTQFQQGNRHLCGKLEELPEADRHIYFPSTLYTQTYMQIHGEPSFAVSYRLVDYCYNVTFLGRNGTFELKPTGDIQCTFKIYLPYGNRVALKLIVGDSSVKDPLESSIPIQDVKKTENTCQGLMTKLFDGSSTWSHCTKKGDAERQIDILSKENKMVIKVSGELSQVAEGISLRMYYTAEPIEEIVRACDFGWVALRQFCITVLETIRLSWSQAETECGKIGGHLISIRSDHAQNVVDRLLTKSPGYREHNSYWIGASDKMHESDFRWSDGLPFSYTNLLRHTDSIKNMEAENQARLPKDTQRTPQNRNGTQKAWYRQLN